MSDESQGKTVSDMPRTNATRVWISCSASFRRRCCLALACHSEHALRPLRVARTGGILTFEDLLGLPHLELPELLLASLSLDLGRPRMKATAQKKIFPSDLRLLCFPQVCAELQAPAQYCLILQPLPVVVSREGLCVLVRLVYPTPSLQRRSTLERSGASPEQLRELWS